MPSGRIGVQKRRCPGKCDSVSRRAVEFFAAQQRASFEKAQHGLVQQHDQERGARRERLSTSLELPGRPEAAFGVRRRDHGGRTSLAHPMSAGRNGESTTWFSTWQLRIGHTCNTFTYSLYTTLTTSTGAHSDMDNVQRAGKGRTSALARKRMACNTGSPVRPWRVACIPIRRWVAHPPPPNCGVSG